MLQLAVSFHSFISTTEMSLMGNASSFFFWRSWGFRSAELHLVSQGAILAMFYYLRVFACMRLCLCVCTYALPVVQTWVLDVTDGPASMQSVCVGQDVPLEQMHSGLLQHCVWVWACVAALLREMSSVHEKVFLQNIKSDAEVLLN